MRDFIKKKLISFLQMIIDDIEEMRVIEIQKKYEREFKPMNTTVAKLIERENDKFTRRKSILTGRKRLNA